MATVVYTLLIAALSVGILYAAAWCFWRYYWFWRNPERTAPPGENIVSPADGTVVYIKRVEPNEPVISYKQGKSCSINDIVREQLDQPKIIIGIFMSPFSVHYNRTPFDATLAYKKEYPATIEKNHNMGSMHWRCMLKKLPIYGNSPHIVENNRAVTRFEGKYKENDLAYYVVQIGGGGVHGIDVFADLGTSLAKGETFGMIRIGSQVDLIVPDIEGMQVKVEVGQQVTAGETIVIE